MPTITWVGGDRNFPEEIQIKDVDGQVVDITGCQLIFKVQAYGDLTDTFQISGSISVGTLGLVIFQIGTEIVDRSGEYYGEVEIEWPAGKILTAPNIFIHILKDLPK